MSGARRTGLLGVIGPGLLIAATGVGAGDLATAGFAGSQLGYAVAWAIVVGALFKFVLTEGLARWQLATGETILHGALTRLGPIARIAFILYLVPFSFFVSRALMAACGVTAHSIVPTGLDPETATLVLGVVHSAIALVLLRVSSFRWFERLMAACVGLMFLTVVICWILVRPDWGALAAGVLVPRVPQLAEGGFAWTIALLGGVGGTLTVICYGYWIREQGRQSGSDVRTCRIDLGVGYAATALFGIATLVIASNIEVTGSGVGLIVNMADSIGERVHPAARLMFLLGAWATVFSSLLGVWQAVPYIFADYWSIVRHKGAREVTTRSRSYIAWQVGIATVPIAGLMDWQWEWWDASFKAAQLAYAVIGACFLPLLALVLLILNRNKGLMGGWRTGPVGTVALILVLIFFVFVGIAALS